MQVMTSGNIQASFWSADKTVAGRGGLPGHKYQTFCASTGDLLATGENSYWNVGKSQRCHKEAFYSLLALDVHL